MEGTLPCGNHVALMEEGRAGPDVVVGDAALESCWIVWGAACRRACW